MEESSDTLREKTDLELVAMIFDLSTQLDQIGQEQNRRIALAGREDRLAADAEVSEGGPALSR